MGPTVTAQHANITIWTPPLVDVSKADVG